MKRESASDSNDARALPAIETADVPAPGPCAADLPAEAGSDDGRRRAAACRPTVLERACTPSPDPKRIPAARPWSRPTPGSRRPACACRISSTRRTTRTRPPSPSSSRPGATLSRDDVLESLFGLRDGYGTLEVDADDDVRVSVLSSRSPASSSPAAPLRAVSTGELSPLRTLRGITASQADVTDLHVINPNFWGGPIAITVLEASSVALATAFLVVPPRSDVRRGLASLFGPLEVPSDAALSLVVDGGALPVYAFTTTGGSGSSGTDGFGLALSLLSPPGRRLDARGSICRWQIPTPVRGRAGPSSVLVCPFTTARNTWAKHSPRSRSRRSATTSSSSPTMRRPIAPRKSAGRRHSVIRGFATSATRPTSAEIATITNAFSSPRGVYFLGIAHDDRLHPEYLRTVLEVFGRDPAVVFCHARTFQLDRDGQVIGTFDARPFSKSSSPHERFAGRHRASARRRPPGRHPHGRAPADASAAGVPLVGRVLAGRVRPARAARRDPGHSLLSPVPAGQRRRDSDLRAHPLVRPLALGARHLPELAPTGRVPALGRPFAALAEPEIPVCARGLEVRPTPWNPSARARHPGRRANGPRPIENGYPHPRDPRPGEEPLSLPVCRFCAAPLRRVFVDLGMSPLCESFLSSDELNRMERFFPLRVWVCEACFLVQLQEYVSPDEIFTEYAYFSSYSTSWLEHARRYTEMAVQRFGLGAQLPRRRDRVQRRLPAAVFRRPGHSRARRRARRQRRPRRGRERGADPRRLLRARHGGRSDGRTRPGRSHRRQQRPGARSRHQRLRRRPADPAPARRRRHDGVSASVAPHGGQPVRHHLPRALFLSLAVDGATTSSPRTTCASSTSRSSRRTAAPSASTPATRAMPARRRRRSRAS